MKRITFAELRNIMVEFNSEHPEAQDSPTIRGVIVYKSENWDKPYSLESRSYEVWNSNRCWQAGKIANSLFGSALDGSDNDVRLDWYEWAVDYCYMEDAK